MHYFPFAIAFRFRSSCSLKNGKFIPGIKSVFWMLILRKFKVLKVDVNDLPTFSFISILFLKFAQ